MKPEDNLDHARQILDSLQDKPLVLALLDIQKAYQTDSDNLNVCFAYAYILNQSNQGNLAIELYKKIIKTRPDWAEPYLEIGILLFNKGYFQEALSYLTKNQTLRPDDIEINLFLGFCHYSARNFKQAEYYYLKASILKPRHILTHCHLGYLYLLLGDYKKGWGELEWNFIQLSASSSLLGKSLWQGLDHDISSLTLFLYASNQVGETLQFVRFIPLLKGRAKKIVLVVSKGHKRLLQEMRSVDLIIEEGEPLSVVPDFDVYCTPEGLPYRFGITLDNLPNQPYLTADLRLQASWQGRLEQLIPAKTLKVGLVWAGRTSTDYDNRRSMSLKKIAELGIIEGISFISLQKDGAALIEAKQGLPGFRLVTSLMGGVTDLADTAAIIKNLDLVISVDTAVVHLAGGLGVPVWVLNRFDACWRWLDGRDDSPWYPSAKLYRQTEPGNWSEVLTRVRNDLIALAATR